MKVLVLNCGSSSIKSSIIDTKIRKELFRFNIERINVAPSGELNGKSIEFQGTGHEAILPQLFKYLDECSFDAIGHRVVHGGADTDRPHLINDLVKNKIKSLSVLAPLHNPINLMGIEAAEKAFPDLPQVAVFDTAFHASLPKRALTYAIPKVYSDKYQIRRFGFHGSSHKYVAKLAASYLGENWRDLRIVSCHLGNGASVSAIEYGRSIETSMGMTPLEGLVMGTRIGDIDAGALLHLMRQEKLSPDQMDQILNKESGLKALSGASSDMRDIVERTTKGDSSAQLALQVFTHRIRKYIGAYTAIMGGVDIVLFTGGIGENSAVVRDRCCQRLEYMGIQYDEDKNIGLNLSDSNNVALFSKDNSRVKLMAVKTDEQLSIARETASIVKERFKVNNDLQIPIAVSARHIHLTQEAVDVLFGKDYQLTKKADLSQPGQFASNERVTIVGPKNQIEKVRILGPCRSKNQVEISRTDEFYLGIDAPVRASGKTENTPGIKLIGPVGNLQLDNGVICAWRHIHMTPDDAASFGVKDKDIIDVKVHNAERPLTFGNVLIRVSPKYKLEMHIDTDEANAAELPMYSEGELVHTDVEASMLNRKTKLNKI